MADEPSETNTGEPTPGAGAPAPEGEATAQAAPPMVIRGQYVKDLSFENPGAPQSLSAMDRPPDVEINVNVNASALSESEFEVVLELNAMAKAGEQTMFMVELIYAGVFAFNDVPQDMLQQLLLIEAPRQLFPFARNIIADATRDGGFPPLMVQPLDFVAMYQQRQEQAAQAGAAAAEAAPTT